MIFQTSTADFKTFDYIFGMDDENISDLKNLQEKVTEKERKAEILMLGQQDPDGEREVPDPYYGSGSSQFDDVLQQCVKCCDKFLDKIYQ